MATNVVLGANIQKTSDRIDVHNNIINPRTKTVIQSQDNEYRPTPEDIDRATRRQTIEPTVPQSPQSTETQTNSGSLSILDQIKQAEDNLKSLKSKKKEQIELVKKQLAELEK